MPKFRIAEAPELLGVSDDTVRRWIDSGRLPVERERSRWMEIDGATLAAFTRTLAHPTPDSSEKLSRLGTVEPSSQMGRVSGIGSFSKLGAVLMPGPLPGSESLSADGRDAVLGWRPDVLRSAGVA